MSTKTDLTKNRIGDVGMFGAFLMLIDTLWGGIAVLPFDWGELIDIVLGISLVIGLPMYILDLWSKRRFIAFLPSLFVIRYVAMVYASTPPTLGPPWLGSKLLIAASVLLQWAKLRRSPTEWRAP